MGEHDKDGDDRHQHREYKDRLFVFESDAYPVNPFYVVEFSGSEGLNTPYQFELTLGCTLGDIDLDLLINHPARFKLIFGDQTRTFRGEVAEAQLVHFENDLHYYKLLLVSKIWRLSLTKVNEVYLGQTVPEIVEAVFRAAGLVVDTDFVMELSATYPVMDFQFQYQETSLGFVHRLMEREGVYYYVRQDDAEEKIVVTDLKTNHGDVGQKVYYRTKADSSVDVTFPALTTLVNKTRRIPKSYAARDFDDGAAGLLMEGSASVDAEQSGTVLRTGGMLTMPHGEEEKDTTDSARAKFLADRWKEKMVCHRTMYFGDGTAHPIRPGYRVTVKEHFHDPFNQTYLGVAMTHAGSQTGVGFVDGRHALWKGSDKPFYHCTVSLIEADVQYRPKRVTPRPSIAGTIPAFIDAEGDGALAEMDERGRYKVRLPYAMKSDRRAMKASCWLRLATPYAGKDHGMHFPLHKGAEVALAFFEGDPDRPYIAFALPNSLNPSVVTGENRTEARIQTGGQNVLSFDDTDTKQRILLQSPTAQSWVRVGSKHSDPGAEEGARAEGQAAAEEGKPAAVDGIALDTEKDYHLFVKENHFETTEGKRTTETTGANAETYKGGSTETYESCDLKQNIEHGRQEVEVTGDGALTTALNTFKTSMADAETTLFGKAKSLKASIVTLAILESVGVATVLAAPFAIGAVGALVPLWWAGSGLATAGIFATLIGGGLGLLAGAAGIVDALAAGIIAGIYKGAVKDYKDAVKKHSKDLRTGVKSAKGVYELNAPVRSVEVGGLDFLEVGSKTSPGLKHTVVEGSQLTEVAGDRIVEVEGNTYEEYAGDRVVGVGGWQFGIGEASRRVHAAASLDVYLGEGKAEILVLGGELKVKLAEGTIELGPLAGFEVKARGAIFEYEELLAGLKIEFKGAHVKEKELTLEHGTLSLKDHEAHVHGGVAHVASPAVQVVT